MLRLPKPRLKPNLKLPIRRTGTHVHDEQVFSRGQVIVIFVLSLTVLIGIMGLAIDVSFLWVNEMRLQKTADAVALAGAVYLPDDAPTAHDKGLIAAAQNGYVDGVGSVHVVAQQNSANHEQMDASVQAPVPTFFMRLFGINSLTPTRTARAQFHLPVPMGSPLNVFGDPNAHDLQGNNLNFWAAINGPCTDKQQGDPYATKYYFANYQSNNSPSNCLTYTTPSNTEYKAPATGDLGAYDYAIKVLTAGTLTVELYDPEYCARKDSTVDTGEWDLYAGNGASDFNTVFTLYAPTDTPYDLSNATLAAPVVSYPGDQSKATNDGQLGKTHSCSSYYVTGNSINNYTGKYITFASFTAQVGTYRLNIQTTPTSGHPADASNMFAIKATSASGTQPQVYAGLAGSQSAMSIFNNSPSGDAYVYLAKVNKTFAGKTMQVSLFDPGEVNGNAYMYFYMPTATGWTSVNFDWRNSGVTLGPGGALTTGAPRLQTADSGGGRFDGQWVVVTIDVPTDYVAPQDGWWKIRYQMSAAAHDRTTWRVSIIDSPVHLVP
jgi:hypothetical protein